MATWFVAFIELCLVVIIFLGGKERATRYFALVGLTTMIWTVMMGFHIAYPTSGIEGGTSYVLDIIPRIMHALGLVVGLLFFSFGYSFPENKKVPMWIVLSLTVSISVIISLLFFTDFILGNHTNFLGEIALLGGNKWAWQLGPFIYVYDLLFSAMFMGGISFLIFKQARLKDEENRLQVKRMILPLVVSVSAPGIADIILPLFGNFEYNWIAGVAQVFWVMVIGYAVIRHNQMNVKYVFTELLILMAVGLLFLSIFI